MVNADPRILSLVDMTRLVHAEAREECAEALAMSVKDRETDDQAQHHRDLGLAGRGLVRWVEETPGDNSPCGSPPRGGLS